MKALLIRLRDEYYKYKLGRNKLSLKLKLGSPVKVNWKGVGVEKNCRLMIDSGSIVRGALHCQKEQATLKIGKNSFVGSMSTIVSSEFVSIGDSVLISHDCYITDTDGHSLDADIRCLDIPNRWKGFKNWDVVESEMIDIRDNVWIGPKSIILKGVVVGEGSVVCAGSVVTREVPANVVVAGIPAKVIKELK